MPFPGPILYRKSFPTPLEFFSDTYMNFTLPILYQKRLLLYYELFPASSFLPFTNTISCQKGLVTPYEFLYASFVPFIYPILYQKSFVTP